MSSPGGHALILDDSPVLRLHLQRQLAALGMSAHAVPSTAQALQHAAGASVVFIELQLLQDNGFAAARTLAAASHSPVILMTGTGRATDPQWALRAGVSAVLTRPIHSAQLQQALAALLPVVLCP